MPLKALLLLLLFASPNFALLPPILENASEHNRARAGLLLGEQNPCQLREEEIDEGNPFLQAGMMAVGLLPQIGNVTSDLSSPELLWGWKASAVPQAFFPLPGTTYCPAGELQIFNASAPQLSDAVLEYRFGNHTASVALSPLGPNPVPLNLDRGQLLPSDFESLHAPLFVKLRGKVFAEYSFRSREYAVSCQQAGQFTVCGCEAVFKSGRKKFEREVSDWRNFSVEVGPNELLWLNPPLKTRLEGDANGEALLFARRMPALITLAVDGREIASAAPYEFRLSNGSCGEMIVESSFCPGQTGMVVSKGSYALSPAQLVLKNASYLPFHLWFGWGETPGIKSAAFLLEDMFGNRMNFTREFHVRSPSPFFSQDSSGALAIRRGSDNRSPAAYPAKASPKKTPDLQPVSALLALIALLGATSVAHMLSRLEGE